MRRFVENRILCGDTLQVDRYGDTFWMHGNLGVPGQLIVCVDKLILCLDADDDPEVQTDSYAYNVSVAGYNNVFRYDNAHVHTGHSDEHHRHAFNWRTGEQLADSPVWLGRQGWPTLNMVLQEAYDWACAHRLELPNPDDCPQLEGRPAPANPFEI